MDFKDELWSYESYSLLVLMLWILIYLMVCTFPVLFIIAAAIISDRRLDSITNYPNFENEKKLILKHEMVRAELQFDDPLCWSYPKDESEVGNSETNPKQAINGKDEPDTIHNRLKSPKSVQCIKEDDMVRGELQFAGPLCFNIDSVCRPHFRYEYEWGYSGTNSKQVISRLDEMAVQSENTKGSCPKAQQLESIPASLKHQDSDSSFDVSSWKFSPRVSWDSDSVADVSSDDDFVGIHEDGLHISDILEPKNDHDVSLLQHPKEEEENKESSSYIRKDCTLISSSEDSNALKGCQRGKKVQQKSHPHHPRVDHENKEYKKARKVVLGEMPKHPDYEPISSRINSYTCWPTHQIPTPQIMAEAGFFYAGGMDYTRCFQCGGGLRNWEPGDNPWIEHARWYPQCAYVLGKKGQKFINAVLRKVELLAVQNRSENSSTATTSTKRRSGTVTNLELDSSQESGSHSAQQEITIEPAVEVLADEGRGSRPWRKNKCAAMEKLIEMRGPFSIHEDNPILPLPTGIPPQTTTAKSDQSSVLPQSIGQQNWRQTNQTSGLESTPMSPHRRQNISSPAESTLNFALSSSHLKPVALPQLDEKSLRKKYMLLRDQNKCRICKERNVVLRVLPCGHLMCCEVCVQDLRFCPVCHASVKTELWEK